MKLALFVLFCLLFAGCATPQPEPLPTTGTLSGTLLFGEVPAPDIFLTLDTLKGTFETFSASDGTFEFQDVENGPCTLYVHDPTGEIFELETNCPKILNLNLGPRATRTTQPEPNHPEPGPKTPTAETFLLSGSVINENGNPMTHTKWQAMQNGSALANGNTDAFGEFFLQARGIVDITFSSPCAEPQTIRVNIMADVSKIFAIDQVLPPKANAPTLLATPGMQGTIVLSWNEVTDALGYEITDGTQFIQTGGLAWMDHTPSGPYKVRALAECENHTNWSESQDAEPDGLPEHPNLLSSSPYSPEISTHEFNVLDLEGNIVATVPWRVVKGTGNCCENYVATDKHGNIYDFGGEDMMVSKNNGQDWTQYTNHGFQGCGEGAVSPAHAGDMLAMNWEFCLGGVGNDGVWSMKYISADDTWVEGSQPIHTPFFDRPYMSNAAGPFLDPLGNIAASVAYIFTNFNDNLHGTGHGISYDGITYLPDSSAAFLALTNSMELPETLRFDADADWVQPQRETHGRALDSGLHISKVSLSTCQITDTIDGRLCSGPALPIRDMQRDSRGRLHAMAFDDNQRIMTYRTSDDVGRTWDSVDFPYIPQMANNGGEWDIKANAALDRTIVSMHADEPSGGAIDLVYVFRDISGTPKLDRILQVGDGGGTASSGVAATDGRFDFMSSGFLPDGRIVMSYRDGSMSSPAMAIGLTA